MDYITKSTTRNDIRRFASIFRKLFGEKDKGRFPVLDALEKVPDVFPNCDWCIVDDNEMPATIPAKCKNNDKGGFTIQIRNEIYKGAFEKHIGAYIGHICHEICHIFLFKIGFVPEYNRSFKNEVIEPYRSVEWQAKALTGEVMMPYEETQGMGRKELMDKYHVSKAAAEYRINKL